MPRPTPAAVLQFLLRGVDTTDDDGVDYSTDALTQGVDDGLGTLQTLLDLPIILKTITGELHDLETGMMSAWQLLQLDERPVVPSSVAIGINYGDERVYDYDARWVRTIIPEAGQVQVMPVSGNIAAFSAQFAGILPSVVNHDIIPGWFSVDYQAGWADDDIPRDIYNVWLKLASMWVLNPAGDLIVGAGIATESINIDQMGQSVGTTSSATNAGYGSRIIQYNKDIDRLVPHMRQKYGGGTILEIA